MADDQPQSSSPAGESPAQEKARLRRERRAAKIQAGGATRLQAIASLQGGTSLRNVEKDVPVRPTPDASPALAVSSASPAAGTSTPDPEEIDISTQHYSRVVPPRQPSPFANNGTATPPFPGAGFAADPAQDPMMAMLQSMIGSGASSMPGAPGQGPQGMPPGLADMFGAMQGNSPEPSPQQSSAWIWRLVHSVFSLGLAIYIVLQTPFTGSKLARDSYQADPAEAFRHFFYLFATFEVGLQTSRYYIEKGQLQGKGILSSIAQFLPEPYSGYIRVVGRYSVIYSTVVSDAMVVVFVLGAASWWNGGAAA